MIIEIEPRSWIDPGHIIGMEDRLRGTGYDTRRTGTILHLLGGGEMHLDLPLEKVIEIVNGNPNNELAPKTPSQTPPHDR